MASYEDDHYDARQQARQQAYDTGLRAPPPSSSSSGALDDFMGTTRQTTGPNSAARTTAQPPSHPVLARLYDELSSLQTYVVNARARTTGGILLLDQLLQELGNPTTGFRSGNPPTSKAFISNLPTVKITAVGIECPVCTEEFPIREEVVILPCKHRFHEDCLRPWLQARNTCPLCRIELPTDDEQYEKARTEKRLRALPEVQMDTEEPYDPFFN